jgi:hypothetical protein
VVDFESDTSLIKIIKRNTDFSAQRNRRLDFRGVESKIKKYISGNQNNKQKEVVIQGVYSNEHLQIISKVKGKLSVAQEALKNYIKYDFYKHEDPNIITLQISYAEKLNLEAEEGEKTNTDQGTEATVNKLDDKSNGPTDIFYNYKIIDQYIQNLEGKRFGIFRFTSGQNLNLCSIHSIEDFYKFKANRTDQIIEEEKQGNLNILII